MNCEEGDIAVTVGTTCDENLGIIVTCVKFLGQVQGWQGNDRWEIDRDMPASTGDEMIPHNHVRDCYLRPLRGVGGTDETILWVGLPNKVEEFV